MLLKAEMDRFLKEALWVKNNKCLSYSFSEQGSYSFGIADYTDFKGQKYNPEIGIFGMDVVVTFKRRGGYRVARRWLAPRPVPMLIVTLSMTTSVISTILSTSGYRYFDHIRSDEQY